MSVASLIASPITHSFSKRAAFLSAGMPGRIVAVMLTGFAAIGDAPPAYWRRLSAAPSSPHPGQQQIADGSWWQIVPAEGNRLDVRWFGAKCDTVTDDLPALTDARDAAYGLGYCDILIPNPGMQLGTAASPMTNWELRSIALIGQDWNRTIIFLPGNSAVCFLFNNVGNVSGGGLRKLCLWCPSASRSTGQAVRLDGDASVQPDETLFQDLKITGNGGWDIPLFCSGLDRATGSPPGLRKVTMQNVFLGRATSAALYLDNVQEFHTFGLGTYGGLAPTAPDINVTSGNAGTRSSTVNLIATNCQGNLIIDRAQLVQANGAFSGINATANSLRCTGMGFCSSITNAGSGNSFTGFV